MKRNPLLLICSLMFVFQTCQQDKPSGVKAPKKETSKVDIPVYTQKEGILTVLMDNSLTSYFIYKGQPLGYEYEMLAMFARDNDLKLEVKIVKQVESILDSLLAGNGDLVAANLTISKGRMEKVAFTKPLFRTKQVLVQRLPENKSKLTSDEIENSLIRDRLDLAGKEIMVRRNSSYELMLNNLMDETGMYLSLIQAPGDLVTENLIDKVANKEIDYTICDQNKAQIFDSYYDNIDIKTPMSLSQPIAWAVNKESIELLSKLNSWLNKKKGSLEFNVINNRYFEMNKRKERFIAKEYDFVKDGKISNYDELIKKYAKVLDWDWRLLAATIYQESKFNPKTKSWQGATGLMQLMPRTAKSYGIQPNELGIPEKNLKAGTQHFLMLEDHWNDELTDSLEIIKFTLGSYNVGLGHVQDAIRLTKKYELNTKLWDDNVAQMLLNKSIPKYYKDPVVKYGYCRGKEPVNYVKSIFSHFQLYTQFTE